MDKLTHADSVEEDRIIELNVGGKYFSTFKSTLTKEIDSKLAAMVNGNGPAKLDKFGRYFIDCDPEIFGHILEYLRFGKLPPHDKVLDVYDYSMHFNLSLLQNTLELFGEVQHKKNGDNAKCSLDLDKYEVLKMDILRTIGSSKENERKYITIVNVNSIMGDKNQFQMCTRRLPLLNDGKGLCIEVEALTPAFLTELQIGDGNLVKAVASDMKLFGYGSIRYNMTQAYCRGCYATCHQCLRIILSERFDNVKFEYLDWKIV